MLYLPRFWFFKKMFLSLDLVMIPFESSIVIKSIWFPQPCFRFIVAKLFTVLIQTLQNRCSPLSLWTNSSLERLFVTVSWNTSLKSCFKCLLFITLGLIFLEYLLMITKVIRWKSDSHFYTLFGGNGKHFSKLRQFK